MPQKEVRAGRIPRSMIGDVMAFLKSVRATILRGKTEPSRYELAELAGRKRFEPGNVNILGWDLDFVDGPALASCLDVLVLKGWNDFASEKDAPFILDCGANIGISALNYKRRYPKARIIAFEPDPRIVGVLRRNLRKNGADDVMVVEAALWTRGGEMPFYCEGVDGSRIVSGSGSAGGTSVRTVDIADYLTEPVDLIKMDIEGAEFDVVPHMADTLGLVENMVIECHLDNREIGRFARILETLGAAGYGVSVNSYGAWRDLVHRPGKLRDEFDQYLLVAAWREKGS